MSKAASHSTYKPATSWPGWRDYLATQMQAKCGVAKREALKMIDRWLRSVKDSSVSRESVRQTEGE